MTDRKVRKNKAAQHSVLENPAVAAEAPALAEFHVPETLAAPCQMETAPVEAIEIEAIAPVAIDPVELAEIVTAQATQAEAIQTTEPKGPTTMTDQISETIENTTQAGRVAADRFQAAFGDVNQRAKTGMEKSAKIVEEMTELTRGNVEALVASSKVAARGVETMTQEVADFGRRSFEQASTTLKSFTEVKSATDFFRLQSEFARSQFDAMIAESSKLSETMIKLAGDMFEPITSRYSVAAERVKNAVAR
jgi:hypothetical protein